MNHTDKFQRYELKFLLSSVQKTALFSDLRGFLKEDRYPQSSISNIYFDTPDFLLIRRSLEKPVYKEKLRLRCYGSADSESTAFVELKKKYKSVVYKRRVSMPLLWAENYLCGDHFSETPSQIIREIDYFLEFYPNLMPAMYISYQRESFAGTKDRDLRITFDTDLLWRRERLSLRSGPYGRAILPKGDVLMEVKTKDAMPLWLAEILSDHKIYKTSFSKYGKAYEEMLQEQITGGERYAS